MPNCSLDFLTSFCVVTPASVGASGSIYVVATSPLENGTVIRFNLNEDFSYLIPGPGGLGGFSNSDTPDAGDYTFTGLVAGTYTIYARNSDTCVQTLTVTVGDTVVYEPKYRLEFYDNTAEGSVKCRIDIEQKDFVGDVTDVRGGANPIRLSWRGEATGNPLTPVIGSELKLTLFSESADQYSEFESVNEREYRATYYLLIDSVWIRKWQGFMIQQNQTEPYNRKTKYDVNLMFTDGLADLTDTPFSDSLGSIPTVRISFMAAITAILQKTGLQLDIWETVNLREQSMDDGDNDSTLAQTYFDPQVYVNDGVAESCLVVLENLLLIFGARIHQAGAVHNAGGVEPTHWQIDTVTKKSSTSLLTRRRDYIGEGITSFEQYANVNYQVMLRRAVSIGPKVSWMEGSEFKQIVPVYGKLKFTVDLGIEQENNLLPQSKFIAVDIANGQLKGWQTSSPNPSPELASVPGRGNVLKIPFDTSEPNQSMIVLSSPVALVASDEMCQIRISFDIFASPSFPSFWLDYDLSVSIFDGSPGDYKLGPAFSSGQGENILIDSGFWPTYLIDDEYLRLYADEPGTWQTVTLFTNIDPEILGTGISGNLEVKFRFDGNYYEEDLTALRAVPTIGLISKVTDNRRRARIDPSIVGNYLLEPGTDAESSPDIIRPDDFNASTNPYVWKLKDTFIEDVSDVGLAGYFLLDNVVAQYLPNGEAPEDSIDNKLVIEPSNKQELSIPLRHFDLSDVGDDNLKNVTKGWLSLEDGTPTSNWAFGGFGGGIGSVAGRSIISRLRSMYSGQFRVPRRLLTGNLTVDGIMPDLGNTFYEVGSGKTYIPMAITQNPREKSITEFEIMEILSGGEIIDESDQPGGGGGSEIPPDEIDPPEPPEQEAGIFTAAFTAAFV